MAIELMNEMAARAHDVELLSWDRAGAKPHYPLDARVRWHKLDMGDAHHRAGLRLRLMRQAGIRSLLVGSRPDVVIGFQLGTFLAVALAGIGLRIPFVAAERNAPHRYDHLRAGSRRRLALHSLRMADRVTVQMDDYIEGYPTSIRNRIVSIANPVRPAAALARPEGEGAQKRVLLSVGRLTYQKNQAVLVEAFARIKHCAPLWTLNLVGLGEDEKRLRQLVADRGLSDQVQFLGAVTDIEAHYQGAHLFCLPSRWEGFPNALAEAMAHGLPVVGYADCAGVRNLIAPGEVGLLAAGNGSVETLAATLLELMQDDQRRRDLGAAAQRAMECYAPSAVFDQWEALLTKIARSS